MDHVLRYDLVAVWRWALAVLILTGCVRTARAGDGVDWLVVAPHPDDEVLMAGGLLHAAVARGERVAVVVVTNGDFTCARDGRVRQAETVEALGALGVQERDVRFLGYADGHLRALDVEPLTVERRGADGVCAPTRETWATRGLGAREEHLRRTGRHAPLTASALQDDLGAVLEELQPRAVVVPHGLDTHPDHRSTWAFVMQALDATHQTPRLWRSLVHASDECWPAVDCQQPLTADAGWTPLPGRLADYRPDVTLPVRATDKLEWIGSFRSQLDQPLRRDWLASFARAFEPFFVQRLVLREGRVVPEGARVEKGPGAIEVTVPRGAFIEAWRWRAGRVEWLGVQRAE